MLFYGIESIDDVFLFHIDLGKHTQSILLFSQWCMSFVVDIENCTESTRVDPTINKRNQK